MSADLIEIRQDLGTTAQVVQNPDGSSKLLAGPLARIGALYEVINDLHCQRIGEATGSACNHPDDGENGRLAERLLNAASSRTIPDQSPHGEQPGRRDADGPDVAAMD